MEKQPGMESNFGLLLCPKSIKNGKYYFNKLQFKSFKK
jgi:hypothetical protein